MITEDNEDVMSIWTKIMDEVDTDKDGTISYEEFYDQMMKVLS